MNTKKLISCLLACSMLAASTAAFAAAPSAYDGQTYESLGYTSDDPDGQFNLAVIANGDVNIYGDTMYIEGSVYSNGTIYAGNGQGNKVDGLFISGTENTVFGSDDNNDEWTQYRTAEGFVHVNDEGTTDGINYYSAQVEHEGAILDKETSFECAYEPFDVPEIANDLGDTTMTVYYNDVYGGYTDENNQWVQVITPDGTEPKTITDDTHIGTLTMNGSQDNWRNLDSALIIDTTDGDVTVVIDKLEATNPSIKVVGDHNAYIYISDVSSLSNLALNYNTNNYDDNWQLSPVLNGSTENTFLYLTGADIDIQASWIGANTIYVNSDSLSVSGSSHIVSNIESGASSFTITGGTTEVTGVVCVPNADSKVVDSGTLYGQLHTNTLTINGAGRIIWQADSAVAKTETESTPEPTAEPTEEPTAEPTEAPELPSGEEVDLEGVGYAYIFGYEPKISYVYDEEAGEGRLEAEVEMAPNDAVTREQVAAMIMRMIDQKYNTKDAQYPLTSNMAQHEGTWYARGLGYLASKGTFDGIESVEVGPVTRGEVAKLVAYGLNLTETTDADFSDIAGNQYEEYIKIMNAYGYMQGMDDGTFQPDKVMTRAEFCSMFNQIIGRDEMGLTAQDGTEVTPELYSIVDLDDGAWYVDVMMKATSAYDENGYIDVETRLSNIRNILDNYDSQKFF